MNLNEIQGDEYHSSANVEVQDEIVLTIEEMIQELPPIAEEYSIYRVPKRLFHMKSEVYKPRVISIGPFYYGIKDFEGMQLQKLRFLDRYLRRTKISVKNAFDIARTWEKQALMCYAEPIRMESDELVRMLLVDGCFIVEYLITFFWYSPIEPRTRLDTKYYNGIMSDMYRDLTMLENQLPFFVLQSLFDILPQDEAKKVPLLHLAHSFISSGFQKTCDLDRLGMISTHKVKHLVDLLSFNFVPLSCRENSESKKPKSMLPPVVTELCAACIKIPLAVAVLCNLACVKSKKPKGNMESKNPPPVTKLREAGVKIKKAAEEKSLMDISFKNGVLEIPHFEIDDCYESTMRNMMAYEHYDVQNNQKYVIQYISFLDELICTKEDVEILVKKGIITNSIGGSNKEVAKLFNDLCKEVLLPYGSGHFEHISQDLHKHCEKLCNQWMASLRHNYCSNPWATISIFAAIFLLSLTFLQTLFAAPSFKTK